MRLILTWILRVASKQQRLLHGWVRDSTTVVNSLSPQMSELVEDAIAFWCGNIVGHFCWSGMVPRNLLSSNLNFSISISLRYFGNKLYKRSPHTVIAFSCGLCWVSGCWILNNALCSMSWMFSSFYCVPHWAINIWHHMLCYLPNIYNYRMFTASLESTIWVRAVFPSSLNAVLQWFCM